MATNPVTVDVGPASWPEVGAGGRADSAWALATRGGGGPVGSGADMATSWSQGSAKPLQKP